MRHISEITPQTIKKLFPAEKFYPMFLNGSFGHHRGNDWYEWRGLCPFHNDRHAGSFYIHKPSGAFICHSCGARGGDIFDLHMMKENISFTKSFNTLRRVASCAK